MELWTSSSTIACISVWFGGPSGSAIPSWPPRLVHEAGVCGCLGLRFASFCAVSCQQAARHFFGTTVQRNVYARLGRGRRGVHSQFGSSRDCDSLLLCIVVVVKSCWSLSVCGVFGDTFSSLKHLRTSCVPTALPCVVSAVASDGCLFCMVRVAVAFVEVLCGHACACAACTPAHMKAHVERPLFGLFFGWIVGVVSLSHCRCHDRPSQKKKGARRERPV